MEEKLQFIPLGAATIGASLLWLEVFLETFRHFPKMSSSERWRVSIRSATLMATAVFVAIYLAGLLIMRGFFH